MNHSQQQLDELKQCLLAQKESLENLLSLTENKAKPVLLRENIGRLSRMDEMHNQSILLANRTVTRNRLKHIRVAIQKFAEGHYGYCDECGETIPFMRLKAYPDAGECVQCKALNEI